MEALEGIGGGTLSLPEQLKAYEELYASTLRGQRMCLCGMLAAEYETLPSAMQVASASGNCSDNRDIAAPPQGGVFVLTALRYAVMIISLPLYAADTA